MHEESIYNLIPREYKEAERTNRHVSKFKKTASKEQQKNKVAEHKTMGVAKYPVKAPDEFLKKGEGVKKPLPEVEPPCKERIKAPVPKKDELPKMTEKEMKDFIRGNALQAISSLPNRPQRIYVDTRKGDKHALEPSGLDDLYIHKRSYGQVPEYLIRQEETLRQAEMSYDRYRQQSAANEAMKRLTDDERAALLDGLKTNWEQIHRQFQGISVITDTLPKKLRKERMESEMAQLERDIELIEKHDIIYVAD